MEGVEIDQKRTGTVVFGNSNHYKDRNEEEIAGYKNALTPIHENYENLSVTDRTIQKIPALTRGKVWDAGLYKEKDGDIIEKYSNGRERVRFKTVTATEKASSMKQQLTLWNDLLNDKHIVPPLVLLAAFNLDFLCIHSFRDRNGRVSRLLLLLQMSWQRKRCFLEKNLG